jgi:hypothetical protein
VVTRDAIYGNASRVGFRGGAGSQRLTKSFHGQSVAAMTHPSICTTPLPSCPGYALGVGVVHSCSAKGSRSLFEDGEVVCCRLRDHARLSCSCHSRSRACSTLVRTIADRTPRGRSSYLGEGTSFLPLFLLERFV